MMLQRAIESKFLLMMSEITAVNEGDFEVFLSMLRCIRRAAGIHCGTVPRAAGAANRRFFMVNVVRHRKVNIVVLEQNEQLASHCKAGDIGIVSDDAGWWVKFVGEGGQVECYGVPYPSYNEALWSAKAAAEFGLG